MIRIMGLDLSITATGVCLPDASTYTITGKAAAKDTRLTVIRDRISQDIAGHGVDAVVIEDLPTHAHGAGITGMVHGTVRTLLMDMGIPYVVITPATLKKFATGKGNANKAAMILAAYKRGGIEFADDNRCDAWWLYQAGRDYYGHPAFTLPAAQRRSLDAADWAQAEPAVLRVAVRQAGS